MNYPLHVLSMKRQQQGGSPYYDPELRAQAPSSAGKPQFTINYVTQSLIVILGNVPPIFRETILRERTFSCVLNPCQSNFNRIHGSTSKFCPGHSMQALFANPL